MAGVGERSARASGSVTRGDERRGAETTLALAGGIRGDSSVPLDDMWGGYLGFYPAAGEGGLDAWRAQYNEHGILLARILFDIDIAWLHGRGVIHLAASDVTLVASFPVLLAAPNEKLRASEQAGAKVAIASLVLTLLFRSFSVRSGCGLRDRSTRAGAGHHPVPR